LEELGLHDDEDDNPDIEGYDSGDDGIEKYRLEQNPVRPQKQKSENQRLNTAAFHSWLEQDQRQRLQDEISASKAAEDLGRTLGDDRRPNENIICSPREYQVELFERAKTRNTIVVLDTGR
jgi:endoribonuclease Dicer